MNQNRERALLLFQQSRHDLAESELRQALADDPQDAYCHALLALCLVRREVYQEATEEARQAVHLSPDSSFAHYSHAYVFYRRKHFDEALASIDEAIRLDPEDSDYFGLRSNIYFQERRWQDALNSAEQGLQFDPEHVACTNLRAMAMVKLGRKKEAGATIKAALARNPDNALTHANQGWTLLEQGEPKKAAEHFREALRLDPQNEWARRGIIEALKARHFVYAVMLKYFLWMAKLSRRAQWGVVLAGYFGNRILVSVATNNPRLAPWILPIQAVYIGFALMTWLAYPFFNLLLRLNRFGRLALSREQTVATNWFGLCLLVALLGLAMCVAKGFVAPWDSIALVFGLLLLPVSAVFRCRAGSERNIMAGLTAILAVLGASAIVAPLANRNSSDTAAATFGLFFLGTIASTWIANILATRRPRF